MREVKVGHIAFTLVIRCWTGWLVTLGKDDERGLQGNKAQGLAAQNFKKIKEKEKEKKEPIKEAATSKKISGQK